jgi:hypothetical protein
MKIESIDRSVKELLAQGYYVIPRFQRPYSWDKENIQDFWDDAVKDPEGDYFIGSMVVFKHVNDSYGVVDGQQRLTTIMMLLAATRDELDANGGSDEAAGLHTLIERKNINNKPQFVLATQTSLPYFQDHILKFGPPSATYSIGQEEKALEQGINVIRHLVASETARLKMDKTVPDDVRKARIIERLTQVRDAILNLKLIFVLLDNEEDAYTIFETLNTRGKDLSVGDLTKNRFATLLTPESSGVDTAMFQWQEVVDTIDQSEVELQLDEFLYHYWLSKHEYVTSKKLFKRLSKFIKKKNAQEVLSQLVVDAKSYRAILEPSYRKWVGHEISLRKSLETLTIFRVKQPLPALLSVVRDYDAEVLKLKDARRALSAIEKFHFAFTAITQQRSSGTIATMYATAARDLARAASRDEKVIVIDKLLVELGKRRPDRVEFDAYFPKKIFTKSHSKDKRVIKYILGGLHQHFNKAAVFDYDQMTIEHLLPQSELEKDGIDDETVGQIGNLILVPQELNSKLSNRPFAEKRQMLLDAGYVLDPLLTEAKSWTVEEIVGRTKELGDIAFNEVWSLS